MKQFGIYIGEDILTPLKDHTKEILSGADLVCTKGDIIQVFQVISDGTKYIAKGDRAYEHFLVSIGDVDLCEDIHEFVLEK